MQIYDKNIKKYNYNVLTDLHYDTSEENQGRWWLNNTTWGYTNLNDGEIEYTSNSVGAKNNTIFLAGPKGNQNSWARFIIDLGEEVKVSNIDIWIGGVEKRMPRTINISTVDNFVDGTEENSTYANNVKQKNNERLRLISTKTFAEAQTTVQKYSFDINK